MKNTIISLILLTNLIGFQSHATTKKTFVTILCQEEDGEIWYEAAIIPIKKSPKKFNLTVIQNDMNEDTRSIVYQNPGNEVTIDESTIIFKDELGGTLTVNIKTNTGALSIVNNQFKRTDLLCHKKTKIDLPNN